MTASDPMQAGADLAASAAARSADYSRSLDARAQERQALAWPHVARFLASMHAAGNPGVAPLLACGTAPWEYTGVAYGWRIDERTTVTTDGWLITLEVPVPEHLRTQRFAGRFQATRRGQAHVPAINPYHAVSETPQVWARQFAERLGIVLHSHGVPMVAPGPVPPPPPALALTDVLTYQQVRSARSQQANLARLALVALTILGGPAACATAAAPVGFSWSFMAWTLLAWALLVAAVGVWSHLWKRSEPERTADGLLVVYVPGVICSACGHSNSPHGYRLCTKCGRVLRRA